MKKIKYECLNCGKYFCQEDIIYENIICSECGSFDVDIYIKNEYSLEDDILNNDGYEIE